MFLPKKINKEARKIAKTFDRRDTMAKQECFTKDHKGDYRTNPNTVYWTLQKVDLVKLASKYYKRLTKHQDLN